MLIANRMPIMDCDEVYNYWEPLHFLIYGSGFQTWEYAPQFALRTYVYIYPLQWISWIVSPVAPLVAPLLVDHQVSTDKLATFVVLRSTLAALSACCELQFITALSEDVPFAESLDRQTLVPKSVSYSVALLLLTSAGMAHAAGAYLPSSSVMILWMLCTSFYIRLQVRLFCAVAVLATLCLGWPFGVVVFVPMGFDILRRHKAPIRLLLEVAIWTMAVQTLVMWVDYRQYGTVTSATLNIFRYNAQGGGDELYGIEPISYYVKNLALNFNYVALLAILFLPLSTLLRRFGRPLPTSLIVIVTSLYLWLSIVIPRPHKEERFLFPIYPALVLAAVVVVQQVWDATGIGRCFGKERGRHLWIVLLLPACLISQCRTMALSKYYTSPLKVFASLPVTSQGLVCTCGEWYRFPSSYYLPEGYQLGFLPSSFSGQLPKYFDAEKGSRNGNNFNDANKEELDRYVNPNDCDYIVELAASNESECLKAMNPSEWTKLVDEPYLNTAETSSLHRVLYLPFVNKAAYNSYSLYARKVSRVVNTLGGSG